MIGERPPDMTLAEGAPGLAEVLGDRAQDRDLARGQPRSEDEAVEAVVLCLAAPDAGERVLKGLAQLVDVQVGAEVVQETEVVDPDGIAPERPHLVRALVADPDAHVLEHRQHIRRAGSDGRSGRP